MPITTAIITVNQWEDFNLALTAQQPAATPGGTPTPVNLTGYTAAGEVFKGFTAPTIYPFTFTFNADRATGKLTASLSDTETGSIPYGEYQYIIRLRNSLGDIERWFDGTAIVKPGIRPRS